MKAAAKQSLQRQDVNNGAVIKSTDIVSAIEKQQPGFKLALPKDFDADRFTRIAITAIKASPVLQKCEKTSVLAGLMLCAQVGLEPNSPLHEASLIPYRDKKTGLFKAEFQLEYRGMLKLAWNSGLIASIDYDKICENDVFKYSKGLDTVFIHEPTFKGDRGEAYAYYAKADLKDGGKAFVVKSKDDIKKHAARFSKAYGDSYKSSPWQTDFDAMAIKTVLKELLDKKLPKRTTNEALLFATALSHDEKVITATEDQLLSAQERKLDIEEFGSEDTVDADYIEEEIKEEEKNGKLL